MDLPALFWAYAGQEQNSLFMILIALVAPAIDLVLLPRLYVNLIEAMSTSEKKQANRWLLYITLAAALLQMVHLVRSVLVTNMIPSFDCFMKTHIMRQILQRDVACNILTSGDIVYLLSTVSELSRTWLEWLNDHILPHAALVLCGLVVFLRLDLALGVVYVLFMCTVMLAFTHTVRRCRAGAEDYVQSMTGLHQHLEDLIRNAPAIRGADMVEAEVRNLQDTMIPSAFRGYHQSFVMARQLQTLMVPIGLVFLVVFLKRIMHLQLQGRITQAQFVSTLFMVATLLNCFMWFTDTMGSAIMDAHHMRHLSASTTDYTHPSTTWHSSVPNHRPPNAALGMENVTFTFQGHLVFQSRSLSFTRGQLTAVVGTVGCGKSTMLRLFLGFCVPEHGHLYALNSWYAEMKPSEVRQCIALVPQDVVLFDASLVHNVRYGNEDVCTEEQVSAFIVEKAGHILGDRVHATSVGPGGQYLSGGQRQLVWCLRVMLRSPAIILMDEPTAFMDDASKAVLVGLLDGARQKGITVLLVTHDKFLLAHCDTVTDLCSPT